MPCRSDYLDPSQRERELQKAAQLLLFVYSKLHKSASLDLINTANDIYARKDYVPKLCKTLKSLTPEQQEEIIYDAHNSKSRQLANWWEAHQEADRKREEKEQRTKERNKLKESALNKLTPEEREVLGF